jgi:hypothetical protein
VESGNGKLLKMLLSSEKKLDVENIKKDKEKRVTYFSMVYTVEINNG